MNTTQIRKPFRIDIWHNVLWSKYKGEVFSSLQALHNGDELVIRYFQIAETHGDRVHLSGIDTSHHRYPFTLLFKGSYDRIGIARRCMTILRHTLPTDADMIILTGYDKIDYWLQYLLLRLKGKKIAVFCDSTINDQPQTRVKGLLKEIFFTTVDGIFAYGARTKEYVVHYGADPQTVFQPCQAAALPFDYRREKAFDDRLALAPPPDAPRYLFVGLLSKGKNIDTLIKAFAGVVGRIPKATLIIVGDGPERQPLCDLAQDLNLAAAVTFTGRKSGPDLFAEYTKATSLILPSLSEAWGLVVNEALAYGCPVIVSERCGCVPELVIEGQTGFVHKVDDSGDLAAKMLAAPAHFSDIPRSAQTCIEHMTRYTPDKAALQMLDGIYATLAIPHREEHHAS